MGPVAAAVALVFVVVPGAKGIVYSSNGGIRGYDAPIQWKRAVISDTGSLAGEIVLATTVAVLPASNVNGPTYDPDRVGRIYNLNAYLERVCSHRIAAFVDQCRG